MENATEQEYRKVYEDLRSRQQQAEDQAEYWQSQAKRLKRLADDLVEMYEGVANDARLGDSADPTIADEMSTLDYAVACLQQANESLSTPRLVDLMEDAGWQTESTNKVNTVYTVLNRDRNRSNAQVRRRNKQWELAGWPND